MAVSACRPPATVNLGVVLPADAALRPASLLVRVIEPQAQRPFGCEDLAFGLVPEVVLGLTEQGRQQFAAGQATSLELLRTGDRLLLVEGLDREGVALAKGCTALGTITGPTQLSLRLEPVVRLGGQPVPERLNLPTGGSIPQVVLPIVDLLGRPASGVTARWYLAGAASATGPRDDQGPVEPSVGGLLTVRASNPLQSGPFIVLVAPRWGSAVSIGGMVTPASVTTEFPAGVQLLDFVAGRVGPVGEHGFTALTQVDGGTSHLVVYRADGGLATVGGPGPMAPGAWRLTLLEDSASGRDTAVAINQDTWVELPAGSVSPRPFLRLPAAPSRVMPLWEAGDQSCSLPPGLFLAMLQNGERRVFNRAGGAVPDTLNLPGAVLATGCVAQVEGGTFAAAVVDVPFQSLYLFRFARGQLPAPQPVQLLALQTGLGFSRGTPHELIATRIDRSLYLASRLRVASSGPSLEATWELALPSIPFEPASGELDGDGAPDLAALLALPVATGGLSADIAVLLALGRKVNLPGSPRVSGVLGPIGDFCNPKLWLQDFDGDGLDDVCLAERAPCPHPQRLQIYLMGR